MLVLTGLIRRARRQLASREGTEVGGSKSSGDEHAGGTLLGRSPRGSVSWGDGKFTDK